MKEKYIQIVQDLIREYDTSSEAEERLAEYKAQGDELESKVKLIERFISCYEQFIRKESTILDLLGILRQIVLVSNRRIQVPVDFYKKYISAVPLRFGLEVTQLGSYVELNFEECYPEWLGAGAEIKEVTSYPETKTEKVLGDSYLYKATGYTEYISEAQKYIMQATLNQKEGTTLLVALRTGGGKSLTFQLPSYYDQKGATIVIVPTVALAIDQEKGAYRLFKDKLYKPKAIHNGVGWEERKQIEEELRAGVLPLVYTSPEVVLSTWFKALLSELAVQGLINRLVIDEAHIVEEWGSFFRTDFQALAIFRKQLLEKTDNKLKTILLSATLTEEATELLCKLFSEEDNLIEIRTDSLRREILYYYTACKTEEKRIAYFNHLVPLLPRPFIAYVGTREDAQIYYDEMRKQGFNRVRQFTGETPTKQREELILQWKEGKIDCIIATSAFGVGVDQKDVRAVVHLYMPPSIDRFYQEVGRGGRDGFPSLSISLIDHSKDYDLVNHLTKSRVLTTERIVARWMALLESGIDHKGGSQVVIDTYTNVYDAEYTGEKNITWNTYVLLFMARNQLIKILDVERVSEESCLYHIQLKDIELVCEAQKLVEKLESYRSEERMNVTRQIEDIKRIMTQKEKKCWGACFTQVYEYAEMSCRSCPICRSYERKARLRTGKVQLVTGRRMYFNQQEEYYAKHMKKEGLKEVLYEIGTKAQMLEILERYELDQLIIPYANYIDKMIFEQQKKVRVYEYAELNRGLDIVLGGVVGICFGTDEAVNNRLYQLIEFNKKEYPSNKYIYFAHPQLVITRMNKRLSDLIDGPIIK